MKVKNGKKIQSKLINDICFWAYKPNSKIVRKLIIKIAIKYDGGEFYSYLLRRIFAHYHEVRIGIYSYGCFDTARFPTGTRIGRYCSFAGSCALVPGNHPVKFKSLHPFFYNPDLAVVNELNITRTNFSIGHDVWIGTNALILPNASIIGTGSIVGAGSVVTHNVPPFAIVGGNPAKIIRYRFSRKVIDEILQSRWWEKDIGEISGNRSLFETFLKPIEIEPGVSNNTKSG